MSETRFYWHVVEAVARRKANAPETWGLYAAEIVGSDGDTCKATGCVSSGVYTRGPRKGRPKYDGPATTEYVNRTEIAAEIERYERETGNCAECLGSGKIVVRVSVSDGTTYGPCPRCKGVKP